MTSAIWRPASGRTAARGSPSERIRPATLRRSSLPLKRSTARRMSASGPRRGRGLSGAASPAGCASAGARCGWRFGCALAASASRRCGSAERLRRRRASRRPLPSAAGACGGPARSARARDAARSRRLRSASPRRARLGGACVAAPARSAGIQPDASARERHRTQTPRRWPCGFTYSCACSPLRMRPPADVAARDGSCWSGTRSNVATRAERQAGARCRTPRPQALTCSSSAGLGLGDHLLGDVRRDLLVALELHRVVAAAAGDRAQVGRVVEHLGHRHLGLDLGHRALRLHAQRAAAARVEVADHVADRVLGHRDRHLHDRLEQIGLGLGGGLLEGHRAGDLERHLGGVDRVVLAVVEAHPHVLDRVAGEHPALHRLRDPLLDRGDEARRDHAALDRVHELEPGARARPARSRCGSRRTGRGRRSASCSGRAPWRACGSSPGRAPAAACSSISAPKRRFIRSTITSTWIWVSPAMICSPVSRVAVDVERRVLLRRAGGRRPPPSPRRPSTSARRRTPSPAPAGRAAGTRCSASLAASTSPARVSLSLATAPMSPGAELVDGGGLLAARRRRAGRSAPWPCG